MARWTQQMKQFCTFTARSYGLHPFNSGQWTGTKGWGVGVGWGGGGIEYGGSKRGRTGRMRWGGGWGDWGQGGGWRRKRVQSFNELSIMQVRHGSQRNVKLSSLEGTRIYSKSLSTNNIAHADSAVINTRTHARTHTHIHTYTHTHAHTHAHA